MALLKEQTLPNGTVVKYHRIVKVLSDFNDGSTSVLVASYASPDIRSSEVESYTTKEAIMQMRERLDALTASPTEENEAERIELTEALNDYYQDMNSYEPKDLTVLTREYPVEDGENMNRGDMYRYLKTLPDFHGATKI